MKRDWHPQKYIADNIELASEIRFEQVTAGSAFSTTSLS